MIDYDQHATDHTFQPGRFVLNYCETLLENGHRQPIVSEINHVITFQRDCDLESGQGE